MWPKGPIAPPPVSSPPPPLTCEFRGASIPKPGFGVIGRDAGEAYGYCMPIRFVFQARGGVGGSYSWISTQHVMAIGWVLYLDGVAVSMNHEKREDGTLETPNGLPAAVFFDAPALAAQRSAFGPKLISAEVVWTMTLYVRVINNGITASCPPIHWSARLNWKAVDDQPVVTGSASITP